MKHMLLINRVIPLILVAFVFSCATPVVVKTPNATKPIHVRGGCNQNKQVVEAEHKEGYSAGGGGTFSRTEGIDTNVEMNVFTADPTDSKQSYLNEIEIGSYSYLFIFFAGGKYWANASLSHCEVTK